MAYTSLSECVTDLERARLLVRVDHPVEPHLEAAEIQRRLYRAGGPAVLFTRPRGCQFPLLANLFGTPERARFLFRDTLDAVRQLIRLKIDPREALRRPWRYLRALRAARHTLPKYVRLGPVLTHETTVSRLPPVVSWPADGGPFITL